jgi:hypothetical protein
MNGILRECVVPSEVLNLVDDQLVGNVVHASQGDILHHGDAA